MNDDAPQPPTIIDQPASASASAMTPPPSGQDNYVMGAEIARGGMGCIMEADDLKLRRTVAMKMMLFDASADAEMHRRFVREAEVLAQLAHPNIVPIHDIVWDDGAPLFYTMKRVNGRTLQAILHELRKGQESGSGVSSEEVKSTGGPPVSPSDFTLDRLLLVFRKVCDALAFAHSKGIIHRDLKPENIMIGEFGEVLVMDWGIAKVISRPEFRVPGSRSGSALEERRETRNPEPETSPLNTMQGSVMGTPQYMSPEQARGEVDALDARSDIFSLGGILYSILTLRPPVEGATLEEVLKKVTSAQIASPSALQAGSTAKAEARERGDVLEAKLSKPLPHTPGGRVPAALSSVVMKALRLDKAERYQNVAEFSADIEAYQAGFATKAEAAGALKQIKLLMLRHKAVTALLAVMLLLSVGFVLKVMASERRATRNAQVATANEKRAVENAEQTRRALAKSDLALAEAAFRSANRPGMVQSLDAVPEDLRDQVWSYLSQKRDTAVGRVQAGGAGTTSVIAALPKQPNQFAIVFTSGVISVVNVPTRKLVFAIKTAFSGRMAFGISPDGSRFAVTAAGTPAIHILNASDGALLQVVPAPSKNINRLVFSPDGSLLVTGEPVAKEGKLSLIELRNGSVRWQVKGNVSGVHFSPDGARLFTAYEKRGTVLPHPRRGDGGEAPRNAGLHRQHSDEPRWQTARPRFAEWRSRDPGCDYRRRAETRAAASGGHQQNGLDRRRSPPDAGR